MKKKNWFWLIFILLLVGLIVYVGIRLYTPKDEQKTALPEVLYNDGETGMLTIENDFLKLDLDKTTSQFTLTEKATGREWLSNPRDAASDPVAKSSTNNLNNLQSTLLLSYKDKDKGTNDIAFNNYQHSIVNGNFVVKEATDNSVTIEYAVGDIQKIYLMPYAITEERYIMFTDKMRTELGLSKSKVNSKVGNVYKIYSPETLAKMKPEERDAALALYPSAAEQAIRVLDTSKKSDYETIAQYFIDVGYTQEDYDLDQQLIAGASAVEKPVFNVIVRYRLEGNDFVVEIPFSEIRYKANFPLTRITPLPMFGAATTQDQGFMLVPEGGGALINLNNGKQSQRPYVANMYGWDYGMYRSEVVNETKNVFPVFGMSRNGGSFICMIEGAAAYSGVRADISNHDNSYNWICAQYTAIHGDQYNVSNKTATAVYLFEKQLPQDTIVQRYRFIDSGSYVDMAREYGNYLKAQHPQLESASLKADMPVSVELLGAIDKKLVKFGMPVDSVVAVTRFDDGLKILNEIKAAGADNLVGRYSGWMNGGVSQKVLTGVRVLNELGGVRGMDSLIAGAKTADIPLYFDGISCFSYRSGLFQGFIVQSHAARYTTRERVKLYPYSEITYKSSDGLDPFYLVTPAYAQNGANNLIKALADRKAYGVAFRDIGNILSADYNGDNVVSREQVKRMNIDTLVNARSAGESVMIKEGFDYAVPYADIITDMDLSGMSYSIIDASVPFYQIAIHGAVNYTGKPLNLANDWRTELLHCAEYGAGLNFTFVSENAKVFQDTTYSGYFGADYGTWGSRAKEIITRYQREMAGLNTQRIVGHEVLSKDVHATTYENGMTVYVNYGTEVYEGEDITVPPYEYVVKGGDLD